MQNTTAYVIELWTTEPDMFGGQLTVLPDGSQIIRGTLVPLEEVTRELYDGYKRFARNPVSYTRFKAGYQESAAWHKGVTL